MSSNEEIGDKAVASLQALFPSADEQTLRRTVVEVMQSAQDFAALIKLRHEPHDIAALRYFLRMLEQNGAGGQIAIGDAIFEATEGA